MTITATREEREKREATPVFQLIRDVIKEGRSTDPNEITERVIGLMTEEEKEEALAVLIRSSLSGVMSDMRERAWAGREASAETARQLGKDHVVNGEAYASAYVASIRNDWWPRFLQTPINGVRGIVRLQDATVEDLRHYAEENRRKALGYAAKARRMEKLADEMESAGVTKLGDLPAPSEESDR